MHMETADYQAARIEGLCPDAREERARWQKWRNISDRITSHPDYRFNGRPDVKRLLLKLSTFARSMMAHHNNRCWAIDARAKRAQADVKPKYWISLGSA